MIYSVIRVSGCDLALDDFVGPGKLEPDRIFRKGEKRSNGKVYEQSGFSVFFQNCMTPEQVVSIVIKHLDAWAELYERLQSVKAEVVLDVGITVGDGESFAPSVFFPSSFMRVLASLGLGLSVSAYPASEDA